MVRGDRGVTAWRSTADLSAYHSVAPEYFRQTWVSLSHRDAQNLRAPDPSDRLTVPLPAGNVLSVQVTEPIPDIEYGQAVSVRISSPGLSVTTRATAKQTASVGEEINLVSQSSAEVFQAMVVAPGSSKSLTAVQAGSSLMMKNHGQWFLVLIFTLLLQNQPVVQAESLYSEDTYLSHVADKKAFRAGDLLTVMIVESAEARSASDRSVERDFSVGGDIEVGGVDEDGSIGIGVDRDAADVTQRAGTIKAAMTVAVMEVDHMGNLSVEGHQRIAIDGEEQLITVVGNVRPVDITADNTVLSSRLLNARIVYNGYDVTDDGEKRNWFYRTLSSLGLI